MKEIIFTDPLYEAEIVYLVGGSFSDLEKYLKEHHGDAKLYSWGDTFDFDDTTTAYQFHINSPMGKDERFYIWIGEGELSPRLLWHETLHLTTDILWTRGIYHCNQTEEAFAYLGGWIFEKFSKEYKST